MLRLSRTALQKFLPAPARFYNLHEYQSLGHLKKFEVPVPKGYLAESPRQAAKVASRLDDDEVVIKAQVLAGGRGMGKFEPSGFKGGVHIASSEKAKQIAKKMIGSRLVTKQTGEEGKPCNSVYVVEKFDLDRELYFALLLDRETNGPVIVASTEGGMDIEDVAESDPEKIIKIPVDIRVGLRPGTARKIARKLNFSGTEVKQAEKIFKNLYDCFIKSDMTQLEINPLGVTDNNRIMVCDAKLGFDDNSVFRHPKIYSQKDTRQEDPYELIASKFGLSYIGMDGNIGCLVNGAGLAMATMDVIQLFKGTPANFLDVGGGADESQIVEALRILQNNKQVDSILINIFGGIMKCDVIASGIVSALKKIKITKPIVVRLKGTNLEEAEKIMKQGDVDCFYTRDLEVAARKVVSMST